MLLHVIKLSSSISEQFHLPLAKHVDVLGAMPRELREKILAQCSTIKYRARQVIWRAGEKPQFIAFIERGKAIALYHASNGRIGATGIWAEGDILGGSSLFRPSERQTTVKCLDQMVINCLDLRKAAKLYRESSDIGQSIIYALSARLRWSNHLTQILQTFSAFERVAAILLYLSERFGIETELGIDIDVALTQEDLAALAGITRQFVSITLHDLEEDKIIRLRRQAIMITNIKRLIKIVPSI